MPKRFTDKNKWEDEWYSSLDNDCKIVWEYLLDRCDHAGIGKINLRLLNFCCNVSWDIKKLESIFNGRVQYQRDFYFIPKYLKFQYPKGLNSNKPAIRSVRNILSEKALYNYISKLYGNDYLTVKESLSNGYLTVKDKDIYKDKDKDKRKDKDIPLLDIVCDAIAEEKYTLQQVFDAGCMLGMTKDQLEHYYNKRNAVGWIDAANREVKNLKSDLTNWRNGGYKFPDKPKQATSEDDQMIRQWESRLGDFIRTGDIEHIKKDQSHNLGNPKFQEWAIGQRPELKEAV